MKRTKHHHREQQQQYPARERGQYSANPNKYPTSKSHKKKKEKQFAAIRKYRRTYTKFWYTLSSVELTHSNMAATIDLDAKEGEALRLDAQSWDG